MTTTICINIGTCVKDREGTRAGETYDPDKRHNCNRCGYFQGYNEEMLEVDNSNLILWSSVGEMRTDTDGGKATQARDEYWMA